MLLLLLRVGEEASSVVFKVKLGGEDDGEDAEGVEVGEADVKVNAGVVSPEVSAACCCPYPFGAA